MFGIDYLSPSLTPLIEPPVSVDANTFKQVFLARIRAGRWIDYLLSGIAIPTRGWLNADMPNKGNPPQGPQGPQDGPGLGHEHPDFDAMERAGISRGSAEVGGQSGLVTLLIGDPHSLYAEALGIAVERYENIAVIGRYPTSGPDAYDLALHFRPNVVILDFWMPDMDGPTSTRMIISALPECKVLLLSGFYSRQDIEQAFQAGAVGFLPKGCAVGDLAKAVVQATTMKSRNARVLEQEVERLAKKLDEKNYLAREIWTQLSALTPREVQILNMLNKGLRKDDIANALFVSASTVQTHIRNILKKAGGRPMTEVLYHARRFGLFLS